MKKSKLLMTFLILVLSLTSCVGGLTDAQEEGFDFSEEEVSESAGGPGFDFTGDGSGDSGDLQDEGHGNDDSGMTFDDDEGLDVSDESSNALLMGGLTNWLVSHDDGTATCQGNIIKIWGNEDETVTINVLGGGARLEMFGFEGGETMFYNLKDSGPGGSIYTTDYVPPGASSPIHFEVWFTNTNNDDGVADTMFGFLEGESDGCKIERSFSGFKLD